MITDIGSRITVNYDCDRYGAHHAAFYALMLFQYQNSSLVNAPRIFEENDTSFDL